LIQNLQLLSSKNLNRQLLLLYVKLHVLVQLQFARLLFVRLLFDRLLQGNSFSKLQFKDNSLLQHDLPNRPLSSTHLSTLPTQHI